MKLLQSNTKLIQIQTRLNKQSYLSRGNLPGSTDARMFLFLQSIKRYPDRRSYPNFYHWYILMKQFAVASIQKWTTSHQSDQDPLIAEFILKQNQKILPDSQAFKKTNNSNQSVSDQQTKTSKSQQYGAMNGNQIQYLLDVKNKVGQLEQYGLNRNKFLDEITVIIVNNFYRIYSSDVQQTMQERRVRIVAKMDVKKCEELKNKISKLQGVQGFQFKKKDKLFKTVNSGTNFAIDS